MTNDELRIKCKMNSNPMATFVTNADVLRLLSDSDECAKLRAAKDDDNKIMSEMLAETKTLHDECARLRKLAQSAMIELDSFLHGFDDAQIKDDAGLRDMAQVADEIRVNPERQAMKLKWTRRKPTKAGWYFSIDGMNAKLVRKGLFWLGPIKPPKPPRKGKG